MEQSVLISVNEMLGLVMPDNGMDLDVLTAINTAINVVYQLGAIPTPIEITNESVVWSDLSVQSDLLTLVKSYIFLKTQNLWDPPQTSFLISLKKEQLSELEWRIKEFREVYQNGA